MEENTGNNTILYDSNDQQEIEFQYNFVNRPWDDRTTKSKICVTLLLNLIFAATISLVINNFYMHYKGFVGIRSYKNAVIRCYRFRVDELPYVVRFHSVTSNELVCLGAVVSSNSVVANGVCVKFGQLRMFVGSPSNPRCRKGFSVDVSESIPHQGLISQKLVLLSSLENIQKCSAPVMIGHKLNRNKKAYIIGRPFVHGRILSRQDVTLLDGYLVKFAGYINNNYTILGKVNSRCPVRAGDLMLQDGKLYGLAAYQRNEITCFADLDPVKKVLREIDGAIMIDDLKVPVLITEKNGSLLAS